MRDNIIFENIPVTFVYHSTRKITVTDRCIKWKQSKIDASLSISSITNLELITWNSHGGIKITDKNNRLYRISFNNNSDAIAIYEWLRQKTTNKCIKQQK